eukprot:Hpha_TRINITY_DN16559_c2_g1::TRINITY_DN16559_c2_g1_i5::g.134384::m.134384
MREILVNNNNPALRLHGPELTPPCFPTQRNTPLARSLDKRRYNTRESREIDAGPLDTRIQATQPSQPLKGPNIFFSPPYHYRKSYPLFSTLIHTHTQSPPPPPP